VNDTGSWEPLVSFFITERFHLYKRLFSTSYTFSL
jgi:hypothetical protein